MSEQKIVNFKKAITLFIQVICFRELLYLASCFLGTEFKVSEFIFRLLPKSYFAVLYVVVLILSPYINKLMHSLDHKKLKWLMVIAFLTISVWSYFVDVLNVFTGVSFNDLSPIGRSGSHSGYSLDNFILMYMIGVFIKITKTNPRMKYCILILSVCILTLFASVYSLKAMGKPHSIVWFYNNPVVVVQSLALFLAFNKVKIKSNRVLESLARATFSVYLLNVTILGKFDIAKYVSGNGYMMVCHIIFTCVVIYLICWVAQIIFNYFYKLIFTPFFAFLERKFNLSFTMLV